MGRRRADAHDSERLAAAAQWYADGRAHAERACRVAVDAVVLLGVVGDERTAAADRAAGEAAIEPHALTDEAAETPCAADIADGVLTGDQADEDAFGRTDQCEGLIGDALRDRKRVDCPPDHFADVDLSGHERSTAVAGATDSLIASTSTDPRRPLAPDSVGGVAPGPDRLSGARRAASRADARRLACAAGDERAAATAGLDHALPHEVGERGTDGRAADGELPRQSPFGREARSRGQVPDGVEQMAPDGLHKGSSSDP